jgi:hypothetical protein
MSRRLSAWEERERMERELALDYFGVPAAPSPWSLLEFEQSVEKVSPALRRQAARRFLEIRATPRLPRP